MNSFCSYFNQGICRSCSIIELSYAEQIYSKELTLVEALGVSVNLQPTVKSRELGFRNKAKITVTGSIDQPILGLSGEDNLDQGREILSCPVHHPKINDLLLKLKYFVTEAKLIPYSISEMKGELKGFIIFYSEISDEMYLRFILRSQESITRLQKFLPRLIQEAPHLKVVSANIQPIPHAILEGEFEIILTQNDHLNHVLENETIDLGPRAFVQTNQEVATRLYQTAAKWVQELNINKFSELFCGQGAFSFFAAPVIESGLGIEINPEAIKRAQETARKRGLSHLNFIAADASGIQKELEKFSPNLVLVNPPRRGLGKSVELLLAGNYQYLIYSSCSHETLALDFERLKGNYEIVKSQIFDMFPHTKHFETLVLLKLRSVEA